MATKSAAKKKDGASARPEQVSVATLGSSTTPEQGRKAPMERQYVGIDLHRRRSAIVRRTPAGETLETVRITNDPPGPGRRAGQGRPRPRGRA